MIKIVIEGMVEKNRDDITMIGDDCVEDCLQLLEGRNVTVTIEVKENES